MKKYKKCNSQSEKNGICNHVVCFEVGYVEVTQIIRPTRSSLRSNQQRSAIIIHSPPQRALSHANARKHAGSSKKTGHKLISFTSINISRFYFRISYGTRKRVPELVKPP